MKNSLFLCLILTLFAFNADNPPKNGSFTGVSQSYYTNEPFYGHTTLTFENGKIVAVRFIIRDSLNHEYFDGNYERHYTGNDLYMQQCRNDWKGVQTYPDSLLKYQKFEDIDVISGATWSYNIFKASAENAINKAKE